MENLNSSWYIFKKYLVLRLILLVVFIPVVSSFGFPDVGTTTSGSTTVSIITNGTDTNETPRFNNLVGNCTSGEYVHGVLNDGTRVCVTDQTGSGSNTFDGNYTIVVNYTSLYAYAYFNSSDFDPNSFATHSDVQANFSAVGGSDTFQGNYSSYINETRLFGYAYYNSSDFNPNNFATHVNVNANFSDDLVGQNATFIGDNYTSNINESKLYGYGYYNSSNPPPGGSDTFQGNYSNVINRSEMDARGYYNSSLVNSTQFDEQGGALNLMWSWLSSAFDTLLGTKTTDDLTEGSTNLYDNSSWNESRGDALYAPIGSTGGNTTDEIFGAVDNDTFLKSESDPNIAGNLTNVNINILNNATNVTNSSYSTHSNLQANISAIGGAGASLWTDNGTYLQPNSSFADDIFVNGQINASDWTNISITESQISDLSHTADTQGTNATFVGDNYTNNINTSNVGEYATNSSYSTHDNVNSNLSGVSYQGYYNASLVNTTTFEEQDGNILGLVYSWFKSEVLKIIPDTWGGNQSRIETNLANNGSLQWHDQDLNTTDSPTFVNITVTNFTINNVLCNASSVCFTLTQLNVSGEGADGSTNDSYALHTNVNSNFSIVPTHSNVDSNGTRQWRDQDVNTTDYVTFQNISVSNITDNDFLCNASNVCFTLTQLNSTSSFTDTVGNNATFIGTNYSDNVNRSNIGDYGYYNSSLTNVSEFEDQSGFLGINLGFLTNFVGNAISNFSFSDLYGLITGNRTAVEASIIGNRTIIEGNLQTDIVGNRSALDGNILGNVTTDTVGQNATFTGTNYSDNVNRSNIGDYGYYNSSTFTESDPLWSANYSTNYTCISTPDCLRNITWNSTSSIWYL